MKNDKKVLLPENVVRRFAKLANVRLEESKIKEIYGEEGEEEKPEGGEVPPTGTPVEVPPEAPPSTENPMDDVGGGAEGMGISKEQQEEIVKSVMDAVASGLQGIMPDASVSVEGGEGEVPPTETPVEVPPEIPPASGGGGVPPMPSPEGEEEQEPLDEVQIALVAEVVRRVVKKLRENKAKKPADKPVKK